MSDEKTPLSGPGLAKGTALSGIEITLEAKLR